MHPLARLAPLLLLVAPLLAPLAVAEEATYQVAGLPLNYETGVTYQIHLNLSAPGPVAGLAVRVTNGSLDLAANDGFNVSDDGLALNASGNVSQWQVAWQAPAETFALGEGAATFTFTFLRADDNGTAVGTWAVFEKVVRPPAIVAAAPDETPAWANRLAWLGVALTGLLVVLAVAGLRLSRPPGDG